ncbi:response regulator [Breoghania sp. L-A4]|uniref:response regulator n=1 Tax=Breoghania sp. L-A4 TaxID=2304600 RepID=UPI0020C0B779|nr:response regulator [Breoghania sp. L-A4]
MVIHILEDEPTVSEALVLLLEQYGHEVAPHLSAEGFFAAMPPSTDDLVIVDLNLPGISGVQVIRWLMALSAPPVWW